MKRQIVKPGFIDKREKSKKIHISELKIGMFVSRLDREWLETPFLVQGFVVECLDDIDVIAEYCEHVWIDVLDETWVPPEERAVSGFRPTPGVRYINKVPAQDEHRKALGVYRESRRITKSRRD